ncbi:MAG: SagB/ThcOx family dehydrogenase [Candidatus Rokubacteria bacterium]|nr:SagB/ThcOx family dehydrogenase [Candidatus Rokubacteria bacterium]
MAGRRETVAVRDTGGLPQPRRSGPWSVEGALAERRSVREYTGETLMRADLGQLLWATQGITGPEGLRTAPSAGALYPLEVYVAVGAVEDLPSGVYRYDPSRHALELVASGDRRAELAAAALGQECVQDGAAVIALAAVYRRTTGKYGERGIRYVHMEVGHAAQNMYLQAAALGLGAVVVGAFDDREVKKVMHMGSREEPVCLMPVGRGR